APLLQGDQGQAHLAREPAAPPLRDGRMARGHDRRALLAHRGTLRRERGVPLLHRVACAPAMSQRWDALRSWHHDWAGLRVAMIGLDARGFAVADTVTELGADVTVVSDGEHSSDLAQLVDVIGARLVVGLPEAQDLVAEWRPDVLVVSAGSTGHPLVQWAGENAIAVASDIELAWRLRDKNGEPAPWLLTAGGSEAGRAAHLAEAMLLAGGARVMACGDTTAGVPVLDALRVPEQWECLVVAVSADDLRYSPSVAAWSAACLSSG